KSLEMVLQSSVHHIHQKRFKHITASVLYPWHAVKEEIAREDSRKRLSSLSLLKGAGR
ncbi:hypothetical protein MMJ63_25360, partial [Bacillus vallismortis]|nr:hypothetical protein [Bacillus vallismortis]